jgi:transcriptional regulator with XRE-family HTH domain
MPLCKLSAAAGVSELKIDHYELGKNEVTLENALRIACALDVPVDALMR